MAVSWERETKINRVNGYWMTSGQGECAMRESDEAGRTAERATGQGIVREKKREAGCGCGTGRRRLRLRFCSLREHISFISYFSFGGMRISRAVVGRF